MTNEETEGQETISGNSLIKETKGSLSEKLLAHTLGYPQGWHVIRTVTDSGQYSDCIYAGNPNKKQGMDMYFNHVAAYTAALKWKEGESTGFENGGGQLLPRVSAFQVGDIIEVLYEPDNCWYDGTILKVKEYEDDIRYTVHYTEENSTQANVTEELIRFPDPNKKKKKKATKKNTKEKKRKKTPIKSSISTGSKKAAIKASIESGKQKTMDQFLPSTKTKKPQKRKISTPEVDLAKEMDLPEGWTATLQSNGQRYDIRSPDGKKFRSKKSALAHLLVMKNNASAKQTATEETSKMKNKNKSGKKSSSMEQITIEEEGDPPWRKTDHDYLDKRVTYKTLLPHDKNIEISQMGTVSGWIDEADVDKQGNPGFISERTGIPAPLFHVTFDHVILTKSNQHYIPYVLESQDLEEYELLDCLVDEREEEEFISKADGGFVIHHVNGKKGKNESTAVIDDDEVPLSSLLKHKKSKRS